MQVVDNVPLSNYSTMRLGGPAAHLTEVHDRMELLEALSWAQQQKLPVVMIGGGSNIIWTDEGFPGLVIVNKILRFELFDEDQANAYLTTGAGEEWDSVVERSVQAGLSGIEALSLIPGTAGGTPVQNVGAYGQEISQTLVSVEAFDARAGDFVTIPASDCGFGYRTSRFKTTDHGRFFISAMTLHLTKTNPAPPFYPLLQKYFDEHQITTFTPAVVRAAVIDIRSHRMPDPSKVANTGSFFANPVVDASQFAILRENYPDMPSWSTDDGRVKLPAAWMLERAGLKNIHDEATGMATWAEQPLVLVNEHAKTTADLMAFKQRIVETVQAQFGITLEQEPELLK